MNYGELNPEDLRNVTQKLFNYCKNNNWAGYDPYDALNSKLFKYLPYFNSRIPRLALTQLIKKSPVNFRPLLRIPKTQNPKAIALFLKAFLKLSESGLLEDTRLIEEMPIILESLRSKEVPYYCWGYSFPWQTRGFLVLKGAPNLVCTVFVADALLDAYEMMNIPGCLDMARSAAEYVLNELYWTGGALSAGFSYPIPNLRAHIHNADLLGSALLCRAYNQTGERRFLEPALKVARYSVSKQNHDGSWSYGESAGNSWKDNFHTGYNLCALKRINNFAEIGEFNAAIHSGFLFYLNHFFRGDGAPKYFDNSAYPIDIHSVAQSIITLVDFIDFKNQAIPLINSVLKWTMANMWDARGFFYFQKRRHYSVHIPFMRWSQAWMLLALATLLEQVSDTNKSICPLSNTC